MTNDTSTCCLACGGTSIKPVADLGASPVLTGALFPDRKSARAAVRGALDLGLCLACGHVQNTAFDPKLVQYDVTYDNSLHFSGQFQAYADALVQRLVTEYDLRGKHVVEIGSGKGDFLGSLARVGDNTGTGYDPTVDPQTNFADTPGVTLVQDYFRPGQHVEPYDLLVCRHVLEHLEDPAELLDSLHAAAPETALFYLEVPAAEFNFGPEGLWDCIYPHVSYFSTASLAALVHRAGFEIVSLERSFHGQFLSVEARPGQSAEPAENTEGVGEHLDLVADFAERWAASVEHWRGEVEARRSHGEQVALWGAGSKGLNFLTAVDPAGQIPVVDLNPRKAGSHLPGTGHRVDLPESLAGSAVSTVLVTNPVYREEIAQRLEQLEVDAEVVTV